MDATLYSDPDSLDSFILRWMAIEKQCPVDQCVIHPWECDPAVLPHFKDRDLYLVEHEAIVHYLQERYPGEPLLPSDPKIRAQLRQICSLIRKGLPDFLEELESMVDHGNKYIAGEQFTLADIYAGAALHQIQTKGVLCRDNLIRYYDTLAGRAGFKEADCDQ